mmetsp:Transcript_49240/g.110459  ORF Transcript_49240/g.110459 Transcript_49240/m.110459 type:complete len:197 (-) Transcript_49240:78-668(-)
MASFRQVSLLVLLVVATLSTPGVGIFGIRVLASLQAAAGIGIPFAFALLSGCFLFVSFLREGPSREQEDIEIGDKYEEADAAGRSPVRAGADERIEPQTLGFETQEPEPESIDYTDHLGLSEKWQWKNGKYGGWMNFDAAVSLELSDAMARGETLVSFEANGESYQVDLAARKQKNLRTGRQRDIRVIGQTQSELM